jgi:mannose-6-phosphate isomerase-like protein (cupin superfamily)
MHKVNIADKFAMFSEHYKPHIAAELNGQYVKLVKFNGEFVFHHHDHEDEMFLVVKGRFRMEFRNNEFRDNEFRDAEVRDAEVRDNDFRDRHEWIEEGEFIVVPRGVEHRPVAEQECWVVLFEPATTLNTGNIVNERTVAQLERV